MLTEICDYIHNYFELEVHEGQFEVSNGAIAVDFLKEGQRFRVRGSALNDGIYTYHSVGITNDDDNAVAEMKDETFTGTVTAMGVPVRFLAIVREISDWCSKNASALNSPYTSESFGGYTYTKATGTGANGAAGALTWRDMFRAKLNAYRKIA